MWNEYYITYSLSNTEQSRAEQSRAEQSRAEQSSAVDNELSIQAEKIRSLSLASYYVNFCQEYSFHRGTLVTLMYLSTRPLCGFNTVNDTTTRNIKHLSVHPEGREWKSRIFGRDACMHSCIDSFAHLSLSEQ